MKINLDQLVLKILDELMVKFGERIKVIDYYITWKSDMLCLVEKDGTKLMVNYKPKLKEWGLELDENL